MYGSQQQAPKKKREIMQTCVTWVLRKDSLSSRPIRFLSKLCELSSAKLWEPSSAKLWELSSKGHQHDSFNSLDTAGTK